MTDARTAPSRPPPVSLTTMATWPLSFVPRTTRTLRPVGSAVGLLERVPMWARVLVGVAAIVVVSAASDAVFERDTRWCVDRGRSDCPVEVRHHSRLDVVECIGPVSVLLWDERLSVDYHNGTNESDREAWTIRGVDDVIVLDSDDHPDPACHGSEIAYGDGLSGRQARALVLERLTRL